jgi:hypothetical protein
MSKGHIDATTEGTFLSLTIDGAMALIKKMVSNQGWGKERPNKRQEGMHTEKEMDVVAAKMDILLKGLMSMSS